MQPPEIVSDYPPFNIYGHLPSILLLSLCQSPFQAEKRALAMGSNIAGEQGKVVLDIYDKEALAQVCFVSLSICRLTSHTPIFAICSR